MARESLASYLYKKTENKTSLQQSPRIIEMSYTGHITPS